MDSRGYVAGRPRQQPLGFTSWLAGAGGSAGTTLGETDAISLRAASNPVDTFDLYATILNQVGLNHVDLTFLHEGRKERLTEAPDTG